MRYLISRCRRQRGRHYKQAKGIITFSKPPPTKPKRLVDFTPQELRLLSEIQTSLASPRL